LKLLYAPKRDGGDLANYAFKVGQHVSGRIAQNPYALRREPGIPRGVASGSIAARMRFAVDLDGELSGRAVEIEHERTRWLLSAEAKPFLVAAECRP
jgi:hypothetical protein